MRAWTINSLRAVVAALTGVIALPVILFAQTGPTLLQSDMNFNGYKALNANLVDYAGTGVTWNTSTKKFDVSAGGGGNVSNSGTPTAGQKATWTDATHIQGVTDNALQWDGGATGLVAATARTSLALVIGTNVQAWDTDLDVWATKTPYAGSVVVTTGKTFTDTNNLTLSGTDGSTLNMGGGGTLGTAAYTASSAYEVPLTFSTGLTRSTNTVTVNTSQNIATLSNLTTNGFVKTGGAVGTLSVDTATYQASSANLTSWAAITRASGIDTFVTTPSSANLRSALTDENGTGALLFSGATTPDFTTGLTIGGAAATGTILKGDGTKFAASTETYAAPGTSGNVMTSNGTNWTSAAPPTASQVYSAASPPTTDVGLFTIAKTGVDLKGAGTTAAFTVPAGRRFLCTGAFAIVTAVTTGGAGVCTLQLKESVSGSALTPNVSSGSSTPVIGTVYSFPVPTSTVYSSGAAASIVNIVITAGEAGSTAVTGTVYVQGFYTQ